MTAEASPRWCSPAPQAAPPLLAAVTVPWWIAGGWAIELYCEAPVRAHGDLDIGCFRDDLPALLATFPRWQQAVHPNSVWLRPADSACWVLQVMPEQRDGDQWCYRRDPRIRAPAADITLVDDDGLACLRPEIQLLYKSKQPRPRDEQDLRAAWPLLAPEAKAWLRTGLKMTSPGHPWLAGGESE
jgi:hypothetical protein